MSVRIHKAMGYGTNMFKPTPQFEKRYEEVAESWGYLAFLAFAEEHFLDVCKLAFEAYPVTKGDARAYLLDIQTPLAMKPRPFSFWHTVVWKDEMGMGQNIVLIPPSSVAKWYRFNDDIDYAEAYQDPVRNRFVKLNTGIYPCNQGETPLILAAMCLYLGVPELFAKLEEVIYTYWC